MYLEYRYMSWMRCKRQKTKSYFNPYDLTRQLIDAEELFFYANTKLERLIFGISTLYLTVHPFLLKRNDNQPGKNRPNFSLKSSMFFIAHLQLVSSRKKVNMPQPIHNWAKARQTTGSRVDVKPSRPITRSTSWQPIFLAKARQPCLLPSLWVTRREESKQAHHQAGINYYVHALVPEIKMQRASFSIDSLISGSTTVNPGFRNHPAFQFPFFYNGYVFLPRSGLYPAGFPGGQGGLPDHLLAGPRLSFPDAPLDCRAAGYTTAASPSSTTSNRSSIFDLQHSKWRMILFEFYCVAGAILSNIFYCPIALKIYDCPIIKLWLNEILKFSKV